MGFERMISGRHLRSVARHRRSSYASTVAVAGVGLGVAALVVVLSVMNGYASVIWSRVVGMNAHVTIRKAYGEEIGGYEDLMSRLAARVDVVGTAAYVESEGFIQHRASNGRQVKAGVMVRGIHQAGLEATTDLASHIKSGRLALGEERAEGGRTVYGIVIGRLLARRLGAEVGSEIRLGIFPRSFDMGRMPRWRKYLVTGIFGTGYHEFDSKLVFVALPAAQRDLDWGDQITGIRLRLEDPFSADAASSEIRDLLAGIYPSLFPSSWTYESGNFYVLIRLQKWSFFLILSLIVVVAGFNVISILTMSVAERRREIGILKAMGASPRSIGRIYTLEGLAIGGGGAAMGCTLGLALCWAQLNYQLIKISGEVYFVDVLPVEMHASDFGLVSVTALLVALLFSILPARDAASLDPVEAIRYE